MIRRMCVVAAVAGVVVLMTAGPAAAKGADQVTITGPGISTPIVVGGDGEPGSAEGLGQLGDASGLFVAMFGPNSSGAVALASTAPSGPLGPKYVLTYRVPGASTQPDTVKQDVYPLAAGGPVTFTAAAQPALGTRTLGGWHRAPDTLRPLLTSLRVPGLTAAAANPSRQQPTTAGNAANVANAADSAPKAGPAHRAPWLAITVGAIGVCVALMVIAVMRRSRPRVTSPR